MITHTRTLLTLCALTVLSYGKVEGANGNGAEAATPSLDPLQTFNPRNEAFLATGLAQAAQKAAGEANTTANEANKNAAAAQKAATAAQTTANKANENSAAATATANEAQTTADKANTAVQILNEKVSELDYARLKKAGTVYIMLTRFTHLIPPNNFFNKNDAESVILASAVFYAAGGDSAACALAVGILASHYGARYFGQTKEDEMSQLKNRIKQLEEEKAKRDETTSALLLKKSSKKPKLQPKNAIPEPEKNNSDKNEEDEDDDEKSEPDDKENESIQRLKAIRAKQMAQDSTETANEIG